MQLVIDLPTLPRRKESESKAQLNYSHASAGVKSQHGPAWICSRAWEASEEQTYFFSLFLCI